MVNLTRRLFLRNTAAAGAAGTVVVAPAVVDAATRTEPQKRIDAAIAEIQAALQEMHPDWSIQEPKQDIHRVVRVLNGQTEPGDPYSHAVLLFAYDGKHGSRQARWFREYR